MRLSKKSRYGLRALIDLSVSSKTEHITLNKIAERNNISPQYLEQVFAALRRAGLVKSVKGAQGGYRLGRPADEITAGDVLEALEGTFLLEDEVESGQEDKDQIAGAVQRLLICQINDKLKGVLDTLTLADLEKDYLDHEHYEQEMYYI